MEKTFKIDSPYFETSLSASACIENVACPVIGDVTGDYTINVSDIVFLVNSILGSGLDASCADMNGDGSVNVSDVVGLVNVILSGRVASFDDASEAVLFVSENSLRLDYDALNNNHVFSIIKGISSFKVKLLWSKPSSCKLFVGTTR